MNLATPLSQVPRVGPVYEKRLKKLGLGTVRDLLFHFPREYADLRTITPVAKLKEGETVCLKGRVLEIAQERTYRKRMSLVHALVQDATGAVRALWFNQPYLTDAFQQGDEVYLAGRVGRDKEGLLLSSPAYEKARYNPLHMGRLVPLYAETAGVSSKWLRFLIYSVLSQLGEPEETLPEDILHEHGFPPFKEAMQAVHFPESLKEAKLAKERFAFQELFVLSLFVLTERKRLAKEKAPSIPFVPEHTQRLTQKLPFQLTEAQRKAAWHIVKDMEKPRPMNRLLQGDVGSGKTVVAAIAALSAVKAGCQVAFMAPTEILAQQHFKTTNQLLAPFKIKIALLTGKTDRWTSPKLPREPIEISRTKLLQKVKEGDMEVVIGTHTLIQEKVRFKNLALVILDEQHRFGVAQRTKLQIGKAALVPHLLSMTATPIPRTLALTVYGDLDLTLIAELPKGRTPVTTKLVAPGEREKAYGVIRKEMGQGRQAFIICPKIEPTADGPSAPLRAGKQPATEVKAVKEEYERISQEVFPDFRVGMLHGKMAQKEKEDVMRRFARGAIDVLVSTSVVEVGVDIPNATSMVIEGAERFGLAQLHQFRGRVGRGEYPSWCFLFTESSSAKTAARLKALQETASGFELAEQDLRLRGPGDLLGKKQWGMPDFAMQQLTNLQLVELARQAANALLEHDLTLAKHPQLKKRVEELRERLHLE